MIKKIKKNLSLINNFEIENNFYYYSHISRLNKIINHYEMLKKIKNVNGDIVELGVFKGISIIRLAQMRDSLKIKKKIYGFDSFGKFPNSKQSSNYDKNFPKIFDNKIGSSIEIKKLKKIIQKKGLKNIKLIKGNIKFTLEKLIKNKIKISFLHLDLDLEEITLYSLKKIYKNISKNGVIVIDDFNIHPGINKAIKKFFGKVRIYKPIIGNNPHFIIKN